MSRRKKPLTNIVMVKDTEISGLYVRDAKKAAELRKHDNEIWNVESHKKLDVILKKIDESLDLKTWGVL